MTHRSLRRLAALGLSLALVAPRVLADDVADEAELYFRIGAEKFMGRDFRGALEYFLRSNRLVRNRNVMFNIARSYEQIGQLTDAFRYYSMALEGETDATARKAAESALAALRSRVAVVEIETDPPGANLYIERKDLGARGTSPRSLAFAPGTYRVLADMPGHLDATPVEVKLELGKTARVRLSLKKIVGLVQVEGAPPQTTVSIDSGPPAPLGAAVSVPPGRHQLTLRLEGHVDDVHLVDVVADRTQQLRARLTPLVGSLVVATDERDAEILIDGKQVGFTPSTVPVAVGRHTVKVRLPGFREVAREIDVTPGEPTRLEVDLRQTEEIAAASRTVESVRDAPGSVSTISRQELRAFGYPTIAEALRGQRGFYVSDNRNYSSVGVRGFSFLGDYGQRLLVLLDGHPTNDNYLGSSYTGIDNRVDLDDIERIEVIRGPGSVVYGTNAFLGVINLVPRQNRGRTGGEVGLSLFDYGTARGRARADVALGDGASAWVSVMGARGKGRSIYNFPELASPTFDGVARDVDGVAAQSAQGGLRWRSLHVQGFYTSRDKTVPTGSFDTIPSDDRTHLVDTRAFVEARFEPRVSESLQLLTRVHANLYNFKGAYPYTADQGGLNVETFRGRWFGAELRAIYAPAPSLRLMIGGEGQLHPTADLHGRDDKGVFLDDSHPFRVLGGYLSADWSPASFFRLSAGSRLDYFSTFPELALSPRVAAIFHPVESNTIKVIGAKAFRAPSLYELYYNDNGVTQIASKDLKPETIYSGEIDVSQRLSQATSLGGAAFVSSISRLISSQGVDLNTDSILFRNSSASVLVYGAEAELRRDWRQGWMAAVSGSVHRASYQPSSGLRDVPDTPRLLGSLRGAIPLLNRALTLASRVSLEGPRPDRYSLAADPPQGSGDSAVIWDVIFSGEEQRHGVSYSLGVYNLFDWRYRQPLSTEFKQRLMIQNGRTMLASLKVGF